MKNRKGFIFSTKLPMTKREPEVKEDFLATKAPASPAKPSSPTKAPVSPTKVPSTPVKTDKGKGPAVQVIPVEPMEPAAGGFDLSLLLGGDLPDSDDDENDFIPDQSDEEATEEEDSDYEVEVDASAATGSATGASSSTTTAVPAPPIGMALVC
jgi:hypothetical protein